MAITFNEKTGVFRLDTKSSSYQMCIDEYNYLLHLYYGKRLCGDCDMKHLLFKRDRGFDGVPYESGRDRTFSLNAMPQEYPTAGLADFRTNCLSVINTDGSCAADLRYRSHKIYGGRKPLRGLPHTFGDNIETLEISLFDEVSHIEVVLFYHIIEEYDAIVRHAEIINRSKHAVYLDRVLSCCADFYGSDYDFVSFYGKHTMERCLNRQPLSHTKISVGSVRGASSHQQNPFVILCDRNADEEHGCCYGFSFVYSGNFIAEAEVDQIEQTRFVMGINPEFFRYNLAPGESFDTPEVVQTFSGSGFSELSAKLSKLINLNICRRSALPRPVVINNWEATYFDFDDEKLFALASEAAKLGIDTLVMDDGWFGKRDDDFSGLGDWYVNENKIKCGLRALCEKLKSINMNLGIWYEPEMISEDSDLYRAHPDWCLNIPNRKCILSRMQFVIDMTRSDVLDYLFERICSVLDDTGIRYIKWDMNRHMSTVYSAALDAAHQGEVYHRYMLGLYSLLDRLIEKYPDLLIEGCSGGGGRFDLGMLYYSPQIWCSDNTDAIDRIQIQYGTSFGYPMSALSAHVSVCPNHQTNRTTPFATRGAVAMTGAFGYELNILNIPDEEKAEIKNQVEFYKKYEQLFRFGTYIRLTDPFENHGYAAWQYVSEDKSQSLVFFVLLRNVCNKNNTIIHPRGLIDDAKYSICGMELSGCAITNGGISVNELNHDYESKIIEIKKID